MDPWDWTVDEVVVNLCKSRNLWAERPNTRFPDSVSFEEKLRESVVDGATLLEHVDSDTLKNELEVKSLGERAAVLYAIELLRCRSRQYVNFRATIELRQNSIRDTASNSNLSPTLPSSSSIFVQPASNVKLQPLERGLLEQKPKIIQQNDPKLRAGEYFVVEGGKKRRRLQLPSDTQPSGTDVELKNVVRSIHRVVQPYLSHNMIPIDSIFYGELLNGNTLEDHPADGSAEREFAICTDDNQQASRGAKDFILRRMRHFLMTNLVDLGNSCVVCYPYPERLVKESLGQSVTLFQATKSRVLATKSDATLIRLEENPPDGPKDDANLDHSWDHLLSNWPCNKDADEVLPLYNESESENDYPDSLLDEMEQEQLEYEQSDKANRDGKFPSFKVQEVIEGEIARYREAWIEKRLSHRQSSSWAVWRKAQGRKRDEVVNGTKSELKNLRIRLTKLMKEIRGEPWKTEKSLRSQCESLQATVEQQEESEWKLRLWASTKPPPKSFQARRKRLRPTSNKREDSDDGDSLESELDSMDDFVDIDVESAIDPWSENLDSTSQNELAANWKSQPTKLDNRSEDRVHRSSQPFSAGTAPTAFDTCGSTIWGTGASHSSEANNKRQVSVDSVLGIMNDPYHAALTQSSLPKETEVIDLTASSPSSSNAMFAEDLFVETARDRVENATEAQISAWNWTELDEQSDRKRIILKHLHCMDNSLRRKVQLHFAQSNSRKLKEDIGKGLGAIKRGDHVNIDPNNKKTLLTMCKLFVCWNDGSYRHLEHKIPPAAMDSALKTKDFASFFDFFRSISNIANQSDTEDDLEDLVSRRKKRRNKVLKSRQGQALRDMAQERRAAGEARSQRLKSQMALNNLAGDKTEIVINTMKEDWEELITLNRHVSTRVKPHQVEGIRFLWREIVSVGSTSVMQGCLLAHTMGLGKTMQTISLLVTIAEAAASSDQRMVDQIPRSLRLSRTLVLCPAGLIENWKDEFRSWIPPNRSILGFIFDISAQTQSATRRTIISKWYESGGVLIVGYEMFRELVFEKPTEASQMSLSVEEQHNKTRMELLDGPNIVVADEAHKLKHKGSGISQAASQFRTPSRIALTGSPLANNLQDYFAMIDWVAPGYLGDAVEFRADYQEPIEAGTYVDSTNYEQRRSLKKLRALITDIQPKVNRADISVMQHDLKPKTEFVIKLPLTAWQTKSYSAFVHSVLNGTGNAIVHSKLFDWMNFLALLCSHPHVFLQALEKRGRRRPERASAEEYLDGTETPVELTEPAAEIPNFIVAQQLEICKELSIVNPSDPQHSPKMEVIKEILVQAKNLKDRVLVFSQHIATLDYLESLIKLLPGNIKSFRFDGNTKPDERLRMVKEFNAGSRDVLLISTRAGGLGLNISGANRVILVDFSFNPMHEEQAVGRAYRIGQQKEVFVYHLVTGGTYEETLHNTTIFKRQLAARVVDQKNPTRSASKGVVFLFKPTTVQQEDLEDFKGKDEIMDHLLLGEVGSLVRGLQTADTLHTESNEELTEEELQEVQEMIANDQLRKKDRVAWKRKRTAVEQLNRSHEPGHVSHLEIRNQQTNSSENYAPQIQTQTIQDVSIATAECAESKGTNETTEHPVELSKT